MADKSYFSPIKVTAQWVVPHGTCAICKGTGTFPARDGVEAQRALNDVFPGDPYPCNCAAAKTA